MRKILLISMICTTSFLFGCSDKAEEMDNLAKAQKCLNEVPQSDPGSASGCLQYVEKYTSQQASILKCSILLTSGGLMEDKVVQAAKALEDSSAVSNKEAAFMSILSLDVPSITAGYAKAVQGNEFCQASGVPGLTYIGGLVVAGSYMRLTMFTLGITLNINNPEAAVTALVDQCTTTPAACAANIETLGATVVTLAQSYCNTGSASTGICGDVNAAVAASGGDTADVGRALFCYMETPSRTYNTVTNTCNP